MNAIAQSYFNQFVATNAGVFVVGWVLAIALIAFPHLFIWLWKITGWTVTAVRTSAGATEATMRKILAEQSAPQKPGVSS